MKTLGARIWDQLLLSSLNFAKMLWNRQGIMPRSDKRGDVLLSVRFLLAKGFCCLCYICLFRSFGLDLSLRALGPWLQFNVAVNVSQLLLHVWKVSALTLQQRFLTRRQGHPHPHLESYCIHASLGSSQNWHWSSIHLRILLNYNHHKEPFDVFFSFQPDQM